MSDDPRRANPPARTRGAKWEQGQRCSHFALVARGGGVMSLVWLSYGSACPKCDGEETRVHWHPGGGAADGSGQTGELLDRGCLTCGFGWAERPADWQESPAAVSSAATGLADPREASRE